MFPNSSFEVFLQGLYVHAPCGNSEKQKRMRGARSLPAPSGLVRDPLGFPICFSHFERTALHTSTALHCWEHHPHVLSWMTRSLIACVPVTHSPLPYLPLNQRTSCIDALDLQMSPESGEVGDAWSGSGLGWWRQARLLTAKLTSGAGRELSLGFHSQLVRLLILSLQRAPSAET